MKDISTMSLLSYSSSFFGYGTHGFPSLNWHQLHLTSHLNSWHLMAMSPWISLDSHGMICIYPRPPRMPVTTRIMTSFVTATGWGANPKSGACSLGVSEVVG